LAAPGALLWPVLRLCGIDATRRPGPSWTIAVG